jgi:hypothetical protein
MTYTLTQTSAIIRDADGAAIPADPLNTDYAAYLAWLGAGGVPNPAPIVTPLAPSCKVWQLRAFLTPAQNAALNSALTALNKPAVTAYFANGGQDLSAASANVIALGASMGLSPAQISTVITQASAIASP